VQSLCPSVIACHLGFGLFTPDMSGKRHYRRRPLTGLSQEAKVKPVEVKKSRESEKHLDTNVIEP